MTNPRSRTIAGALAVLLLAGSSLVAQDRAGSRTGTSTYGVPYWQLPRDGRPGLDDGMAPRLYERRQPPSPPAVRRNYYPNMRTGQYTNPGVGHHCTPSRGSLAGRR